MTAILICAAGTIGCFAIILAIALPDMIRARRQLSDEPVGDSTAWPNNPKLPHRMQGFGEVNRPIHNNGDTL